MNLIFALMLSVLAFLLYFSNRENQANKWCAIAGGLFCLGVWKEVFLYDLVPLLERMAPNAFSARVYGSAYSFMTWALYSFAMCAAVVFSLYSCNLDKQRPRLFCWICRLLLLPILVFSCFFPPFTFRAYQLVSVNFWRCYSSYNLVLGAVFAYFLVLGVVREPNRKAKQQKRAVAVVFLPPIFYWLLSIFVVHPLNLSRYFHAWQGNIVIVGICIALFIWLAFKDGMMGLRLRGENYRWNSDMSVIRQGDEYTGHMLKNQMAKMGWCVDNMKEQYLALQPDHDVPEELSILSRSLDTIQNYMEKKRKYSDRIVLAEASCPLAELVQSHIGALGGAADISNAIGAHRRLLCDSAHLGEVLENLLRNAMEATGGGGHISITEGREKKWYLLHVSDDGCGMSAETLEQLFKPYFTTKNTERNFGLGLAYCQNVMEKHGGLIRVKSQPGEGSTFTLCFPTYRLSGEGA